ncbi:MAG: hypothetical protein QW331_01275 [Candidatus Woesearchaeota archaeon]
MKRSTIIFSLFILFILMVACKKEAAKFEPALVDKEKDEYAGPVVKKAPRQFTPGCQDSDNGIKAEEFGFVNGTYDDGVAFEQRDSCVGPFLVEYFCLENTPANKNIKCENCQEGVCKKSD